MIEIPVTKKKVDVEIVLSYKPYMASLVDTTNIELANNFNMMYTGEVYYGIPAQKLSVDFDTGSPDAWVYSYEGCSWTYDW